MVTEQLPGHGTVKNPINNYDYHSLYRQICKLYMTHLTGEKGKLDL